MGNSQVQPVLFPEYAEPVQEQFPQVSDGSSDEVRKRNGTGAQIQRHLRAGSAETLEPSPVEGKSVPSDSSHGLARSTDPPTSHAAALSVDVNGLQLKVLEALRAHPMGLTNDEIAERTGLPLNSISPRSKPLVQKGLIFDSGMRRKTASGSSAIVWRSRL